MADRMNDELENYGSKQNNQYMGQSYASSGVFNGLRLQAV